MKRQKQDDKAVRLSTIRSSRRGRLAHSAGQPIRGPVSPDAPSEIGGAVIEIAAQVHIRSPGKEQLNA